MRTVSFKSKNKYTIKKLANKYQLWYKFQKFKSIQNSIRIKLEILDAEQND